DAGEKPQERALAGAIGTDNSDPFSLLEFQTNLLQGANLDDGVDGAAKHLPHQKFLEGDAALLADFESQADMVDLDSSHSSRSGSGIFRSLKRRIPRALIA